MAYHRHHKSHINHSQKRIINLIELKRLHKLLSVSLYNHNKTSQSFLKKKNLIHFEEKKYDTASENEKKNTKIYNAALKERLNYGCHK